MKAQDVYSIRRHNIAKVWRELKPTTEDIDNILNKYYSKEYLRSIEKSEGIEAIQLVYILAKYSTRH